ncbi:hypothetical protein [Streptomyces abyssomicinicus]|uniref:hypothetical protein n=1 Tax=Streptomyces abyssomicinicus TaxID=574929 RepID=UPI001C3FC04F
MLALLLGGERLAGVGKATLSRRFATRDELISAVFADRMDAYAAATREALADPDPWRGLPILLMANAGVLHAAGDAAPGALYRAMVRLTRDTS